MREERKAGPGLVEGQLKVEPPLYSFIGVMVAVISVA